MTRLEHSFPKNAEDSLRSLRLPSQAKTPQHRPSWLFRLKVLTDILLRTRGGVIAILIASLAIFSGRVWNTTNTSLLAKSAGQETLQPVSSTTQAVTLYTAKRGNISASLALTGTVVPQNLLNIAPSLSGLPIEQLRVESGDRVSAGQTLAVLDSSILQAQLQQAEANLVQAQTALQQQKAVLTQAQVLQQAAVVDAERYNSLFDAGAISQEQLGNRQIQALTARQEVAAVSANLESARANIDSKAAEIARIKALIAQTVITAPTAGTIAERFATIGDAASTNSPLYSLMENHQLVLELHPEQSQLSDIEVGMPVAISAIEAGRSLSMTSTVEAIEPTLDAQSRQATVKVPLAESSDRLRAGMFLQAKISTGTRRHVVIPAEAIITQPDGRSLVFTISDVSENGTGEVQASTVEVTDYSVATENNTGQSEQVEILSGLSVGSQVVVGGASYLQPGDRVSVIVEGPPG